MYSATPTIVNPTWTPCSLTNPTPQAAAFPTMPLPVLSLMRWEGDWSCVIARLWYRSPYHTNPRTPCHTQSSQPDRARRLCVPFDRVCDRCVLGSSSEPTPDSNTKRQPLTPSYPTCSGSRSAKAALRRRSAKATRNRQLQAAEGKLTHNHSADRRRVAPATVEGRTLCDPAFRCGGGSSARAKC